MPHITIPSWLHCKSVLCPNHTHTHTHQIPKLSLIVLSYEQHLNQSLVLFSIMFIPCFRMGKAHGWGTFQKCGTMLDYCLILGPFDFWIAPHLEAYPT